MADELSDPGDTLGSSPMTVDVIAQLRTPEPAVGFTSTDFLPGEADTTHQLEGDGLLIQRTVSGGHIMVITDARSKKKEIPPAHPLPRWIPPLFASMEKIEGTPLYGIRFCVEAHPDSPTRRTIFLDLVVPPGWEKRAIEMLKEHGIHASSSCTIGRRYTGDRSLDALGVHPEIGDVPVVTIGIYTNDDSGYQPLKKLEMDAQSLEDAGVIQSAEALIRLIGVANQSIAHPEILVARGLDSVAIAPKLRVRTQGSVAKA